MSFLRINDNIINDAKLCVENKEVQNQHNWIPETHFSNLMAVIRNSNDSSHGITCGKLELISEQIKFLQHQAEKIYHDYRLTMTLNSSQCNLVKIPGNIYHVYKRLDHTTFMSIISPDEWGSDLKHEYMGAFRYEKDLTWTKKEDIPRRDDSIRNSELAISRFHNSERPQLLSSFSDSNP
ncbi:hypothetical protein HZS_3846 [Henneguya salminicola]|nr:hypothetical protein HZS_3846 [Henneguya salminicola]